ncbi:hypothetical protein HMPREF9999_02259 [Alloprevotella sp. oral taxon 473 str. F0040]|nr:hypothetical protein HMPREF9999_02259 [Alloprevotella sp. oral taxon 473 str. F0040]
MFTRLEYTFLTCSFAKVQLFWGRHPSEQNCNDYNLKIIHPKFTYILQSLDITIRSFKKMSPASDCTNHPILRNRKGNPSH